MIDSITLDCHAKLNLFLRILSRESGGMHTLETLFCRIDLADQLAVERTGAGIELEVEGADLGAVEDNLVWRAADAVLQATGRPFGVRLKLTKRIPHGAGLGGGSSDAAAALDCVNRMAGNAIPRGELFHMAARLGADVPFFLSGAGLALGWGRGTRLLELPPLDERPILLLVPSIRVSTGSAYQWIDESRGEHHDRGAVAMSLPLLGKWSDIARVGGNDFESVVFSHHPELHRAFEALARTSPMLCRMTGSGSAIFAVYRSERDRDDAVGQLGSGHGMLITTGNWQLAT